MDLNAELESRGINLFLPLDPGPGMSSPVRETVCVDMGTKVLRSEA